METTKHQSVCTGLYINSKGGMNQLARLEGKVWKREG